MCVASLLRIVFVPAPRSAQLQSRSQRRSSCPQSPSKADVAFCRARTGAFPRARSMRSAITPRDVRLRVRITQHALAACSISLDVRTVSLGNQLPDNQLPDARLAQSLAGAEQDPALQLCFHGGLQLALFAAVAKLAEQADTIQAQLDELAIRQAASDAATQELRARAEQMEQTMRENKAAAEARIASIEAAVTVHYALRQQLAETRIRELQAEKAMLLALLGKES
jgi:hypothetical protein